MSTRLVFLFGSGCRPNADSHACQDNALMGKDGRITELGQQYINDNSTSSSPSGPTFSGAKPAASRAALLPIMVVAAGVLGLMF